MPAWLNAPRQSLHKYASIYVRLGCDVRTIDLSLSRFVLPVRGTQVRIGRCSPASQPD